MKMTQLEKFDLAVTRMFLEQGVSVTLYKPFNPDTLNKSVITTDDDRRLTLSSPNPFFPHHWVTFFVRGMLYESGPITFTRKNLNMIGKWIAESYIGDD